MSVFNLSNSITELTKIRKLRQVELAWGEVRIVAGKRINTRLGIPLVTSVTLENIAGKMKERSWSWCLNMPHARMWPDITLKPDNRETHHHHHPNASRLNSALGPANLHTHHLIEPLQNSLK